MPRLLSLLPVLGVAVLAVPATLPTVPVRTEPSASPGTCLPNGIDASKRKNLVNADGESYPVGLWKTSFDDYGQTSYAATAVVQLLVEELLGYNTRETGTGTWEVEGLYRLLGCTTPFDADSPSCGERDYTDTHVLVDAYMDPAEWSKSQLLPGAPVRVGSMGYEYFDGQFVSEAAFDAAVAKGATPLNFYQGLDVRQQPWRFFDQISMVNTSRLGSCSNFFLNLTAWGDFANLRSSCPDGYFWLSPACRGNSSQCIPYFSPFSGWLDPMIAQKAIMWNIPLAIAGSNNLNDFEHLVKAHRCIFSWQQPSSLFGTAHHIRFPSHEAAAYAIRNYSTAEPLYPISKFVSHDLPLLAPELSRLVASIQLDVKMMGRLLREQNRTNATWRDVACKFIKANPKFVRSLEVPNENAQMTQNTSSKDKDAGELKEFNGKEFSAGFMTGYGVASFGTLPLASLFWSALLIS